MQGLGAAHPCGSVRPRSADTTLRIIIIDESPVCAAILKEGLCAAGHVNVLHFADRADLLARICAVDEAGIVLYPDRFYSFDCTFQSLLCSKAA